MFEQVVLIIMVLGAPEKGAIHLNSPTMAACEKEAALVRSKKVLTAHCIIEIKRMSPA